MATYTKTTNTLIVMLGNAELEREYAGDADADDALKDSRYKLSLANQQTTEAAGTLFTAEQLQNIFAPMFGGSYLVTTTADDDVIIMDTIVSAAYKEVVTNYTEVIGGDVALRTIAKQEENDENKDR